MNTLLIDPEELNTFAAEAIGEVGIDLPVKRMKSLFDFHKENRHCRHVRENQPFGPFRQ